MFVLHTSLLNLFTESNKSKHMEKIKAGLNIVIFIFLAGFIGLEVWTLVSHLLKT